MGQDRDEKIKRISKKMFIKVKRKAGPIDTDKERAKEGKGRYKDSWKRDWKSWEE